MVKYIFAFPGQGAQTPGMMKAVCEKHAEGKAVLDRFSKVTGIDVPALLWNSTDAELALKNGGWNDRRFEVEPAKEEIAGRKVTILRYEVSEFGTYKVTFELKPGKRNIENMVLFAGRRNMIEKNIQIL